MLRVKRLTSTAQLPSMAHNGDLAFDLYSDEQVTLPPNSTTKVNTGIAVQFDRIFGFPVGGKIEGRSGLACRGIHPIGGIIDAGYAGNVGVVLRNTTSAPYDISVGDRIAQLKPELVLADEVVEVSALESTARNDSGFGSSGK